MIWNQSLQEVQTRIFTPELIELFDLRFSTRMDARVSLPSLNGRDQFRWTVHKTLPLSCHDGDQIGVVETISFTAEIICFSSAGGFCAWVPREREAIQQLIDIFTARSRYQFLLDRLRSRGFAPNDEFSLDRYYEGLYSEDRFPRTSGIYAESDQWVAIHYRHLFGCLSSPPHGSPEDHRSRFPRFLDQREEVMARINHYPQYGSRGFDIDLYEKPFREQRKEKAEQWCEANGYTDLFFQEDDWWAFPPNAVMPVQIPV